MKFRNLFSVAAICMGVVACDRVPPGNVGVRVNNYGSSKGVDAEVLTAAGYYWTGLSYNIYLFPTFTQTYTWSASPNEGKGVDESFTFQTSDGMMVNADVGISYHIEPDKAALVFQKYRQGIDEITNTFLHNYVRDALVDAASSKTVEEVYGNGKVALLADAQERVQKEVGDIGIVIEKLSWAGIRLPQTVTDSINAKIQATQQAQQRENEVATAQAEAQKAEATAEGQAQSLLINAKAEAQANKLVAESITPVLVQWQTIKAWDGKLSQVSGGATPFINLPATTAAPAAAN